MVVREFKIEPIQVSVERVDGYSAEVFFPYSASDSEVVCGDAFAQEGKREILAASQGRNGWLIK
jgi:hypothetical protein